jgi:glycosyltransferase involved in cell wall biosynthesis
VLRLLDNPAEASRLGARGYAYASEFFDWERITDDLERLYFGTLEHASSGEKAPPPNVPAAA